MKYTESHEWVELQDGMATIGVSNFAQKELGDIVYVELPQIGKEVKAGEEVAVLESTKAAADVYSPLSGTIVEVNKLLNESSELINQSPEKNGWLFKLKAVNIKEYDNLMDSNVYLDKFK